ncbi:MAG: SEC-C domain-containing protein [Hyphomonadaceae bacterium]|nr:SEC-C domain-containing protein [Hyphomonadaceae bacterium]
MALQSILDLDADHLEAWERTELLDMLGEHVRYLGDFWLEQRTPRQPIRSQKVGRNEPCPCGSGKKWKKCCGAGTPPILH